MGSAVYVYLQGFSQTRDKLGRFAYASTYESYQILTEAAEFAQKDAQDNAPKDLGYGAKGIHVEAQTMAAQGAQSVSVVTKDRYMVVQEYGRRPGKAITKNNKRGRPYTYYKGQPSTHDVAGWGARHGFGTKRSVYMLARSIGRKGFKGKFFMTHAGQKANIFIRQRLVKASVNLAKMW